MTKEDFIEIAAILSKVREEFNDSLDGCAATLAVAEYLAQLFQQQNSRFNYARFMRAASFPKN